MIRTISDHVEASLQTAVTVLDQTRSPRTVGIVSVIHIGLQSYYDELNDLIARHDGAVLYEGIGSLSEEEIAALTPRERAIYERLAPLHDLYEKFAGPLGLVFQGKALHYDREHWINADLPLKQLLGIWADRDLPPLPFEHLPAELFEREQSQKMAAAVLLQMPRILSAFNGLRGFIPTLRRFGDVLIERRNQAAIAAFDALPADQNALIIYGAGHTAGLLDALRERWYWRKSETWHTAFKAEAALDPFRRIKSLLGIG
ncbi:MAG TPA: hypothetical protein VKV26_20170 [Dehalococcoidia bacterium]|nr:hypothetical protein [Dehalococcoidia bacterium]